eukprot:snap_masked-scaffold_47-processed-gene-1.52-mRNA-1 protein AED:1.00 eAED:1.00 QI:0/0/0/0/1/1/2/0/66
MFEGAVEQGPGLTIMKYSEFCNDNKIAVVDGRWLQYVARYFLLFKTEFMRKDFKIEDPVVTLSPRI